MPRTKYEADDGDIKPIRLDAQTIAVAGAPPAGATTDNDYVKVSKGNREFGMRPRGVRLSRNVGTAELPNMRYKFLPVLTQTAFNSGGYAVGQQLGIGGVDWEIIAKVPEDT